MPLGIKYGKWKENSMSRALDSVRNGDNGGTAAGRTCSKGNVAETLMGRTRFEVNHTRSIGSTSDPPEEVEQDEDLVSHVLKLEKSLFGITPLKLRILVFDLKKRK